MGPAALFGAVMRRFVLCAAMTATLASAAPALAQADFTGSWANRLHEDWIERAPGPAIGDYSGLPINDEARAVADAYQVSMQNMPERQCIMYTSQYLVMGPQNVRIDAERDPISGAVIAWRLTGGVDRPPHVIWMDGRPHPSKSAEHTPGGFSTGVMEGNTLTVETTHLSSGLVWRNGIPHSDQATMTEHYLRHGDTLTVVMILEDPVYFEEPFIRSASFVLDPNTRVLPEPCEPQVEVPRTPGEIPHYLPGTNPYLKEVATFTNLPLDAVRGGAATTYPEYWKQLKASYKRPDKCTQYCCGGTGVGDPQRNNACRLDAPAPPQKSSTPARRP